MEDEIRRSCYVIDDMSSIENSPVRKIIRDIETGKYSNIVMLNGAGISPAPDFVTLRKEYDTDNLFTLNGYLFNRSIVDGLLKQFQDAKPTPYHYLAKDMYDRGYLRGVFTQNIDGIEKKLLGVDIVSEMHGNLDYWKCAECEFDSEPYDDGECKCCGGDTRPNVVFYGETTKDMEVAKVGIAACDLLIVAGTSLRVEPVNRLPHYAPSRATILVIDKAPTRELLENLPLRPVTIAKVTTDTFASKVKL